MNRPAAARLLVLVFFFLIATATLVRAQQPSSPDPWGFDDEVKVEVPGGTRTYTIIEINYPATS